MPLISQPIATASCGPSPATTRLSRRQFESLALAGAAYLAMPDASAADAQDRSGWIDAHVHVWTSDTERYPLAPTYKTADMQPPSFTPEQLFAHCRPVGVDRVVLIQMSFYGYDNRYMLDMIAAHPRTFSGVGIVDEQAADVADRIKELANRGVRGLRIHPDQEEAARWIRNDGMGIVWNAAREHGLAICPLINPSDLPHVDAMCGKFPGVRVVIDHFARIGMSGRIEGNHLDALVRLARFPDVFVKTSAFYALGKKLPPYLDLIPMIRRLADTFGPERLMWGSDCPFQVQDGHSYAGSIALIRDRIDFLSDTEKQSLLRNTAEKIFFSSR